MISVLVYILLYLIFIIAFLICFIIFWNWNRGKGTLLYQVYDYLTWLYTYQFWEYEKKIVMYDWLKENEVMKKRIGINDLIIRLKEDIENGEELSDKKE